MASERRDVLQDGRILAHARRAGAFLACKAASVMRGLFPGERGTHAQFKLFGAGMSQATNFTAESVALAMRARLRWSSLAMTIVALRFST
jgi:hypothetical protein